MLVNPIVWSDEFSVGIESIDEQHKKLIDMIKTLHDAIADGKASEVMDEIFNGLFDYANYHFSYEEELFDKYGYPDAENHKKEHTELKRQVAQHRARLATGDRFMGEVLLLKFMQDWLVNHIMKTDMKFAPFLILKGVM